ncbi:MAG: EamA family transporter [Chloroflexi bacterium]|nr:MAG: EamA family transporter [Chloroflexota bacterium]
MKEVLLQKRRSGGNGSIAPYLGLVVGVLAVSFASIFIRLADAPALVIGAYRLTIASLVLSPLAYARVRHELGKLSHRDWALAVLSGLFLGVHFAAWIASLEYTSVAASVVLVTTSPLFVGVASHFLLGERLSFQRFLGIIVAITGAIIIGIGGLKVDPGTVWGDFLALIGAVAVSGYFLIGRSLRQRLSIVAYIYPTYWTAATSLIIACLVAGLPFRGYTPRTYLMFVLLALVPQILGHSSFNWALRYLSSTFVTVSTLGEPVGATILAYLILGEVPSLLELIGGIIVLGGIFLVSREEEPSTIQVEAI